MFRHRLLARPACLKHHMRPMDRIPDLFLRASSTDAQLRELRLEDRII